MSINIAADSYIVEVRNLEGSLLNTLTGSVQSGLISDTWDLKDGGGNVIVSGPLQATFFLDSGGTPVASPPLTFRLLKHITGEAFAIAYANYRFPSSGRIISDSVVNVLRWGEGFEPEDYDLLPQYFNVPYADNPFEWFPDSSNVSSLTTALADENCANFYWMGHGWPNLISPAGDDVGLSANDIATLLVNRGQRGNQLSYNHPYRLVILDGCETWSIAWANAWGIPVVGEETKGVFEHFGLDFCAYVGWKKKTAQVGSVDARYAYGDCLYELFQSWYEGFTLRQCLTAYSNALKDPSNSPYLFEFDSWGIAGCGDLTTYDR